MHTPSLFTISSCLVLLYSASVGYVQAGEGPQTPQGIVATLQKYKESWDKKIKERAPNLNPNVVYVLGTLGFVTGTLQLIKHAVTPIILGSAYGISLTEITAQAKKVGNLVWSCMPHVPTPTDTRSSHPKKSDDTATQRFTESLQEGSMLALLSYLYLGPQAQMYEMGFLGGGIAAGMLIRYMLDTRTKQKDLQGQLTKAIHDKDRVKQASGFVIGFGCGWLGLTKLAMVRGAK